MKGKKKVILLSLGIIIVAVLAAVFLDRLLSDDGGVSEQEALQARKHYETNRLAGVNDSYPFCNDRNLYVWNEEEGIEQRTLEGKPVKNYAFTGDCDIAYVNNEEVFIVRYNEEGDENELWAVPIDKNPDGDELKTERAEKVLTDEIAGDFVYAYKDILVYCTLDYIYKEYDRSTGKDIAINKKNMKQNYSSLSLNSFSNTASGDTVLLHDGEEEYIYAHQIGSGEVKKIDNAPTEEGSQGVLSLSVCIKNYMFYSIQSTGYTTSDVWLYNSDTGKGTTFLAEKDIEEAIRTAGLSGSFEGIDALFTDGNTLYMYLYVDEDMALFQCEIKENTTLSYNRELNEYITENEQEILGIAENRVLLSHIVDKDETIYGIYDLAEQRYTEVGNKDEKKCYFWYRQDTIDILDSDA